VKQEKAENQEMIKNVDIQNSVLVTE